MKTLKQLERLRKIHQYVKVNNTGTPSEFAQRLGISESQWYNVLEDLKATGFPIMYCKKTRTYFYDDYCELEVNYSVELLTIGEKVKIAGGRIKKFFTPVQLEYANLFL